MEVKNLMSIMVVALVGAVILTGFLPVLGATQDNIGDPITYINDGAYEFTISKDIETTHTFNVTAPNNYCTIDGIDYQFDDLPTNGFFFLTDGITVCRTGATMVILYNDNNSYQYNVNWGYSYNVTYSNGVCTLVRSNSGGDTTFTDNYTYIGYQVEKGDYVGITSSGNRYYMTNTDFIAMGNYTSGDNDTTYNLINGVFTTHEDYVLSVAPTGDIVSGTTDVKLGHLVLNVGDESFTPYIWLISKEIHGHKDSGAMYDIYGLIPLIVAVGLLMFAITAILIRRV